MKFTIMTEPTTQLKTDMILLVRLFLVKHVESVTQNPCLKYVLNLITSFTYTIHL